MDGELMKRPPCASYGRRKNINQGAPTKKECCREQQFCSSSYFDSKNGGGVFPAGTRIPTLGRVTANFKREEIPRPKNGIWIQHENRAAAACCGVFALAVPAASWNLAPTSSSRLLKTVVP
jgi:hypothetical protein